MVSTLFLELSTMRIDRRPNRRKTILCLLLLTTGALCACGGGPDDSVIFDDGNRHPNNWQRIRVTQLDENGSTLPFVTARQSSSGNVHIAYYNADTSSDGTLYNRLLHLVWDPASQNLTRDIVDNRPAPSGVNGFDRCDQFDFVLDADNTPIFIYPTYEVNPVLQQVEADIMLNLYESGHWYETTGAVGYVDRNPVYQDGHATENMSMAVDSQGNIHFCYQYFTEGMDSANFRYPDLYYALRQRSTIHEPISDIQAYAAIEELVDGNAFTTYGDHNSVGYFCKLILDENDQPHIFYAEHGEDFMGTFALKVAYKNASGQWRRQVIETLDDGWEIDGLSAAMYPPEKDPPDGEEQATARPMAVAYGIRVPSPEPDNGHHLRFASNRDGDWVSEVVDESTWCGSRCSLAIDANGIPAIAYFDEQSHAGRLHQFLKYAEFSGLRWITESVDEYGDVGRYNTLWFNGGEIPTICTFSDEDNDILIIRQTNRIVSEE
jgi:hypothetical protein